MTVYVHRHLDKRVPDGLEAEAGRTYLARALVEGQRWRPEMLDGATMRPVPINCSAKPDDEDPGPIRR